MQEYFILALVFVWTIAAIIQDFRKEEVPNWLSFSLIAFALVFRAFYSVIKGNADYFLLGLYGFAIFFVLAQVFYYSKACKRTQTER